MQKNNTFPKEQYFFQQNNIKEQYKKTLKQHKGVKNMTTSETHIKRILTAQEVIDALRRNRTVSITDNILRIQKVFKNNPFMFCNFSNARCFCFDSIDASYFRCHGVGILSVKEDIKDNFVVFWTSEYGEDMLEVYKPANKKALDNIYKIITMGEAPEVENLFNIGHYSFCFARPLNR